MSSDAAQDGAKQPRGAEVHEHARQNWRHAAQLGVEQRLKATPWVDLDATPTERCIRLDYCSVIKTWTRSETVCKMESTQFAEGAMRRCFRLLKETQAPGVSEAWRRDWTHASAYVAKEYKDKAVGTREAYERDCTVRLSVAAMRQTLTAPVFAKAASTDGMWAAIPAPPRCIVH
jgi:hypothetical protein